MNVDESIERMFAAATAVVEAAGSGDIEVVMSHGGGTSVKAYDGAIESLSSAESFAVGVRVIAEGRVGFAHAGSHDPDVVADVVAEARENVRFAEPDAAEALAHADGVAAVAQPQLWNDAVAAMSTDAKTKLALDLERRVRGADPRIASVRQASFGDSWGASVLVSSTGIRVAGRSTACSVGVQALASDAGETQIGYGYDVSRDPALLDVDRAAVDAVERSTRLLGAVKPMSATVTMVLEPRMAATFVSLIGGMCSGETVLKGRSPFADRMGEQVASDLFTLVDDPCDPLSFGAEEFDGEGLACRRNPLVSAGVLQPFLQNTYTARRCGAASTGSAVRGARSLPGVGAHALALRPGGGDLESLISNVELGVLVNSFAGLHSGVNPVSGDFSVGADGLMIRGGRVAEPVREITLASTLQRMLTSIGAVGADVEYLPSGIATPSMVIDGISMSGK